MLLKNGIDVYGKKIDILIKEDKILKIAENISLVEKETIDLNGKLVMPGVIDVHTHMREPGLEYKEDFYTGSLACLKGGVTTFMDMPNTDPFTISLENLKEKSSLAKKSLVNYGFHLGITKDSDIKEIKRVYESGLTKSLKVFMNLSTGKMLIEDTERLNDIFSSPFFVLVHAENEMVEKAINLSEKYNKKTYFCHVSSIEDFEKIKKAKEKGLDVFIEVTPHHLFLSEDDKKDEKLDKLLNVKPCLKTKEDNIYLIDEINKGYVDTIGTDHAPHSKEEKLKSEIFGMPGVETSLALMLDAYNKGKIKSLDIIQKLMCENPAKIFNISKRGFLKEGNFADIIVIDLEKKWAVKKEKIYSKCAWSAYEKKSLVGKNIMTIVNGKIAYIENEILKKNTGKEIEYYE